MKSCVDPDQLASLEDYRNLKDKCTECTYWVEYSRLGKFASLIHEHKKSTRGTVAQW